MLPYLDNPPEPADDPETVKERQRIAQELQTNLAETRHNYELAAPARYRAITELGPALTDVDTAVECRCGCHPSPADMNLHNGGVSCPCQDTPEQRREKMHQVLQELAERHLADEEEHYRRAVIKTAENLGAHITAFLPAAPFVVAGTVDGRAFYLRERHDNWRLVIAGDDDPLADVWNTRPAGALVIAEGTTESWDWQTTRMVSDSIRTIREYLRTRTCPHTHARTYCPDCGIRIRTRAED